MGVDKHRRKAAFADGITVAGSAGFSGSEVHSGVVTQQGSVNFIGNLKTVNAQFRVNTPQLTPAGSASNQYAGLTRLNSGIASVVVSTTVVKSNALIFLGGPIVLGALAASSLTAGQLGVSSITEGASFAIAWTSTGQAGYPANVDIPWKIELQA